MFEPTFEDKLSRKITRLIERAEQQGRDNDPDFLELIEKLYQKRAEMYAGHSRGEDYSPPFSLGWKLSS